MRIVIEEICNFAAVAAAPSTVQQYLRLFLRRSLQKDSVNLVSCSMKFW
jgi:hypothetical protein